MKQNTMKRKTFFVTGTDTDVGKTVVAVALIEAFNAKKLSTLAIKPIAAGCEVTDDGLRNADALMLQNAMSLELPYAQLNPVAFQPPIAPHIAAAQAGKRVSVSRVEGICRGVFMKGADITIVEGAGGWRVPLNERETMADLARALDLPVILVVGMKLGCINHALLTVEAIARDGLPLAGWVANQIDPDMDVCQENINTLKAAISAPCLGIVPYMSEVAFNEASKMLTIDPLLLN